MNPNIWYDPMTGEVCQVDTSDQTVSCMPTSMTCSFERGHGHEFYNCIMEESGCRFESVFHDDPATGKFLLCEECVPDPICGNNDPTPDPIPYLENATFCPDIDNTFNTGTNDCLVFGSSRRTGTIPFVWTRFDSNCSATPLSYGIELKCDLLGTLTPQLVIDGSDISLRLENIFIVGPGTTQLFSYIRQ
jgi:hypothetical protein